MSPENNAPVSSDQLHNENCFNYLRNLTLPKIVLDQLPRALADGLSPLKDKTEADYDPTISYADLYTQFFDYTEENIEQIYDKTRQKLELDKGRFESLQEIKTPELLHRIQIQEYGNPSKKIQELDSFISSIYHNDNNILPNTFNKIKHIPKAQTPSSPSLEKSISQYVRDKGKRINLQSQSPEQTGSLLGRAWAAISRDFKPQHTTSLATIRHYKANENSPICEYRFGTQGQRHKGIARISPLFERFLKVQARKQGNEGKITHIYFNNLGRDRTDWEGKKEKRLTEKLEDLENRHKNIAVITLPADKGLMHKNDYKKTEPKYTAEKVYNKFLLIAQERSAAKRSPKDFFISPRIRKQLFDTAEEQKLKELLDKSFDAMGINKNAKISAAQRQAVWVHFIKYELTNHIITKLNPDSINFSCKDAIDRGGVSSAYYNLMKSFEQGSIPMNREEFEQALHAAPTVVKARGMNHHLKVIWNAVDVYINANNNKNELKNDENKKWLIDWRDANRPHARIKECKKDLNDQPNVAEVKEQGISEKIQNQSVGGKRSLLDRIKDFMTKLVPSFGKSKGSLDEEIKDNAFIETKREQSNPANLVHTNPSINSDSSFEPSLEMTALSSTQLDKITNNKTYKTEQSSVEDEIHLTRTIQPSTTPSFHGNFDAEAERKQSNTANLARTNLSINSDSGFEPNLEMTSLSSTHLSPLNKLTDMKLYVIEGKNDKAEQSQEIANDHISKYSLTGS